MKDIRFFFQAEDGIRDYKVTGVQTCALPILRPSRDAGQREDARRARLAVRGPRDGPARRGTERPSRPHERARGDPRGGGAATVAARTVAGEERRRHGGGPPRGTPTPAPPHPPP